QADFDESTGSYGSSIYDQALIIVTLVRAGQPVSANAVDFLLDSQSDNGAWALFGDTEDAVGDTNTTALAIQALIAGGRAAEIDSALDYLHTVQNEDGGFPYQNPSEYGTDTDANSTAVVYQALVAAGEALDDWAPEGTDPLVALISLADVESGAFFWQAAVPAPNVLATAQAIPAIAGYTFVNLPQVEVAVAETMDVALPAAGGTAALSLRLAGLGLMCLSAGGLLRRR
ncbi:MAG: terpene cyclase/mutase family protein, partial [Anaerolineae bacterium]|nr:terpene cyclase/mutase family protein [Anaerolineae bacterium]